MHGIPLEVLVRTEFEINIKSMLEEKIHPLVIIFLDLIDKELQQQPHIRENLITYFLITPILQMITFLGLLDNLFANLALGGVAEARDRVSSNLIPSDHLLTVWTFSFNCFV